MKKITTITIINFLVLLSFQSFAQTANLSIQGVLRTAEGDAVENGDYDLTFRLYTQATTGNPIWEENIEGVNVKGGIYSIILGAGDTPLNAAFDQPYFLGVSVEGGVEMIPRARLTSSPYALSLIGSENVFPNSGNVGIGDVNPSTKLSIKKGTGTLGLDAGENANRSAVISAELDGLNYYTDGTNTAHVFTGDSGEKMRIETNGNVGIGTNDPQNKLHVKGNNQQIKVEGVNNANIGLYKMASDTTQGASIGFNNANGNTLIMENAIGKTKLKGDALVLDGQTSIYDNGEALKLVGTTHTYLGLYPKTDQERKAFFGFGDPNSDRLFLNNQATDGDISIYTTGNGEVLMNTTLVVNSGPDKIKTIGYHRVYSDLQVGTSKPNYHDLPISIWAQEQVRAIAFLGDSDRRIKKNLQISNSQNDLDILNQIEVTDYEHIDPSISGPGIIKGVIAQQVKSVYPEAVSETYSIIPSVFDFPTQISQKGNIASFTMSTPHDLSIGNQIQILTDNGEQLYTVIATPTQNSFTVEDWSATCIAKEVFVYGKAINDFNVVDYDRIFTLSVSATQELARKIEALEQEKRIFQKNNDILKTEVTDLNTRLRKLEALLTATGSN